LQARQQATAPRKTGDTYATYIRKWKVRQLQGPPAILVRVARLLCNHNTRAQCRMSHVTVTTAGSMMLLGA
jgi:hypothetical protein